MAYKFKLNSDSLKRRFSVYVVIARGTRDTKLYVGKTGDNRDGCNPVISRCGNHFSFNKVHSQVRNLIPDYEDRRFTYVFEHFDCYDGNLERRRLAVERINEMERWLNEKMQEAIKAINVCELANPYGGKRRIPEREQQRRMEFRTQENREKIEAIVEDVVVEMRAN
jgi:hypothetical protein